MISDPPVEHNADGTFQKGVSSNPGGKLSEVAGGACHGSFRPGVPAGQPYDQRLCNAGRGDQIIGSPGEGRPDPGGVL